MKLLVRNLARTTTEADVRALFEPFGNMTECVIVMDKTTGESKGFGFVEMPVYVEAKKAIKKLNNIEVAGSRIRVKKAEDKPAE